MKMWEQSIASQLPELETSSSLFLNILGDDGGGYYCSPIDSITFARTGMDGIHYSLLTDFSSVGSLEEAFIVCVSPMDFGNCVRVVARNIWDFFCLHFSGHELLLLNDFETIEEYKRAEKQLEEEAMEDEEHAGISDSMRVWREQKKQAADAAVRRFGFRPVADPVDYMLRLRAERSASVALATLDGLGVMPFRGEASIRFDPHPWQNGELPYGDIPALRLWLREADAETKLSFIRDYQYHAIADTPSQLLLYEELLSMGLPAEAKRLLHRLNN